MLKPKLQIIVAEDDVDDKLLLLDALSENLIDESKVVFAEDGEDLLNKLENADRIPTIIILDLNMPKKDGREALKEIKMNEKFKHIPVIVLTTSSSEVDVAMTYKEGGNTYFTKPRLYSDLVEMVGVIKKYWLEKALLA